MNIQTKFNLGERVAYLRDNKVCFGIVKRLFVDSYRKYDPSVKELQQEIKIDVFYSILNEFEHDSKNQFQMNESYLFATKEELLKSL